MNKQYLKHSSPEIFGLLNENIFHLSFSDPVNLDILFFHTPLLLNLAN